MLLVSGKPLNLKFCLDSNSVQERSTQASVENTRTHTPIGTRAAMARRRTYHLASSDLDPTATLNHRILCGKPRPYVLVCTCFVVFQCRSSRLIACSKIPLLVFELSKKGPWKTPWMIAIATLWFQYRIPCDVGPASAAESQ